METADSNNTATKYFHMGQNDTLGVRFRAIMDGMKGRDHTLKTVSTTTRESAKLK